MLDNIWQFKSNTFSIQSNKTQLQRVMIVETGKLLFKEYILDWFYMKLSALYKTIKNFPTADVGS